MQENVQNEESGVSLIEILRLLLSKIKLLILVVIAAAIAGGSYAFFTSRNDVHYGTRVEFYVNPEKPKTSTDDSSNFSVYGAYGRHVMDNMVRLLKSEKFAEKLLLNGDKLPKLKYMAGETNPWGLVVPQENSWSWFTTDESKEAFNKALENLNKATAENATAEEVEKAEEEVFRIWRATPTYKRVLKSYAASVNYSYLDEKVEIEEANNLARSFIYVDISVTGEENETNELFAKEIHKRVSKIVPLFVEANMTVPADYQGTNCEETTTTAEIRITNPGHRKSQAIKYAVLFGAAVFVVAAVVIIIIDKSDKRLRDADVIIRKFNVPVLGIVPSIEELNDEVNAKKAAAKKEEKNSKKEAK